MARRLFLFAGYNAHGVVDDALVYYVQSLAKFGDIVLCMDSDCSDAELQKLSPYVLHATARRHGEYDFGSYKRAYTYAADAGILNKYDFVYMVNDSVYGPLMDLTDTFDKMEHMPADAFGIVCNPHKTHPHIQSWFIGMRKSVFLSPWYDKFMRGVTKQVDKGTITRLYEQGFSRMITEHNLTWQCIYTCRGRSVYNDVKRLYRRGMPFMKKVALPRHRGALGRQILYVLNHISPDARDAIVSSARATYGEKYIDWLLTRNPIKIIYRNIAHSVHKILTEGI